MSLGVRTGSNKGLYYYDYLTQNKNKQEVNQLLYLKTSIFVYTHNTNKILTGI
jgi:hypothetical protein